MATNVFSYNPSCKPDAWVLLIGPDRVGSAAIDRFNRYIGNLSYDSLDLYSTDYFTQQAKQIFPSVAELREIQVSFLFPDSTWVPASIATGSDVQKWLDATCSQKPGHQWICDNSGPADAAAWVQAPSHVLDQLTKLCSNVSFKHAVGSCSPTSKKYIHRIEIMRLGDWCRFSLWNQDLFLYGQLQRVEVVDDLFYVLSLLADKYDLSPGKLELLLTGEWSIDFEWLTALRQRFSVIQGRESGWSNLPGDLPPHWYTPLSDLYS